MSTAESQATALLRKEGVVLVILTATVYVAFLVREMGYADFFRVPHELIAASHIGLFSAAKALMLGALAYIAKVNLVWIFRPRGERFIPALIRYAIGVALVLGFVLYPYASVDARFWWLMGIFFIFLFGWFVWPLVTQRSVAGYENKLAAQVSLEADVDDILSSLLGRLDRAAAITLGLAVAMMVFAYGDGRRHAIEQKEFNVVDGESNVVLIRVYGDLAVFVAFDPKLKKLDGLVRVANISSGKGLSVRQTLIGRLTKAELKESSVKQGSE